jgi:hypothetical protein
VKITSLEISLTGEKYEQDFQWFYLVLRRIGQAFNIYEGAQRLNSLLSESGLIVLYKSCSKPLLPSQRELPLLSP